ncbi:helix-turn-helix domain-containing protein [Microbacterium sp.]|uniref:ArsR/SmtB family transcription factor n=1 Tax=Microbacterium sp. TaxID=51671 RepID=UPI0028121DB2|nr:helix-turn-helix domain-containing protein [Microbacterium sp.]
MTEARGGEGEVTWMTSAMLKAYSHPLRRQILRLLARREFLRAADVAAELDVPANSVSFHLRALADAGLIREAPERARDRRDRVWTHVKSALNLGDPRTPVADEQLGNAVLAAVAEDHQELLRRALAWSSEYVTGRESEVHGTFTQQHIRLTSAEFKALMEQIAHAVNAAEEAHERDDPDARLWQIDLLAADDQI